MNAPTIAGLNLPDVFYKMAQEQSGIVLVCGPIKCGKSTTLAALINDINEHRNIRVISLESRVDYVHSPKQASITQWVLGDNFATYAEGLEAALNHAPNVVLVEDLQSKQTMDLAFRAAQTKCLVLGSLRAIDATVAVSRILDLFDDSEIESSRVRLGATLRWVVVQRLAPKLVAGKHALFEIMGDDYRVQECIIRGEREGRTFYGLIEQRGSGWCTFDQSCIDAFKRGFISRDDALVYCSKRVVVTRGIERFSRGDDESMWSR